MSPISLRVATRFAKEFPSEEALRSYLKVHPGADRSDHTVKKVDPREYARERAKFAPPKKKGPCTYSAYYGTHYGAYCSRTPSRAV